MFDEMLKEYNELEAELERRKKEASATIRPKFQAAFQPFFDRHPGLERISFTAYTPYFNDGDECIYGVNEPDMTALGIEMESWDANNAAAAAEFVATGKVPERVAKAWDGWAKTRYETPEAYLRSTASKYFEMSGDELASAGAIGAEYDAVQKIIQSVPDDVMKGMFGDHVRVVITRDGAEAEEYDHE